MTGNSDLVARFGISCEFSTRLRVTCAIDTGVHCDDPLTEPLRVGELTGLHLYEASRLRKGLVRVGFLELHNPGRGAVCGIPGASLPTPEEGFGGASGFGVQSSAGLVRSSAHLGRSSAHLEGSSAHTIAYKLDGATSALNEGCERRNDDGCFLTDQLDAPVVDMPPKLTPQFVAELDSTAAAFPTKERIAPEAIRAALLRICLGRYVALDRLATRVACDGDALRQQHVKPLTKEWKLLLAFPMAPTHAEPAYRSAE